MFSLVHFFRDVKDAQLALVHPGITLTNLTSQYPAFVKPFVKFGMRLLFPTTKRAARNIVKGIEEDCQLGSWIGPRAFDVWGKPKEKQLKDVDEEEIDLIGNFAKDFYNSTREAL